MIFHAKPFEKVLEELNTSAKGLSEEEAARKLAIYGKNELKEAKKISPVKIFLLQFKSIVIYILIFAAIVSAVLSQFIDMAIILAVLAINAILGFVQEYRAEKAIEALKKLSAPKATIIRDGKAVKISSSDVVPGDILVLGTGDRICADARLIEISNFETQEAALTGESLPVKKSISVIAEKTMVADMRNMVFSGTIAVKGKAHAVVVATGMGTEIGKIAKLVQETKREETPLQKKLGELGKTLGYSTIAASAAIFLIGLLLKKTDLFSMLLTSTSLAVAAIPEGLPAVVTISLAIGIQRIAKRKALMRRLPSVETLGSVNVVCTDKTGTLTKNEMTVKKIFANNSVIDVSGEGYETKGNFSIDGKNFDAKKISLLLRAGMMCNDSKLSPAPIGDPTEISLIASAEKGGISHSSSFKRVDEMPFDSERKMMSTLNFDGKSYFVFSKGAVESILRKSSRIFENNRTRKITESDRKKILEANRKFAESALRVLAFAYKPSKKERVSENDFIFLGLQAMIDPPREDAKLAMEKCRTAGIRVVMITGDHEITAKAIGREFGITGRVANGNELENASPEKLLQIISECSIFARVNPEHKLKIVSALQSQGNVVAMTGDGVNDAPALKKADIGIAMGITGTDVAKEASDMILMDDNFASIVNAVEEGRGVYENIRKFFAFLLSGNIAEVLIILLSMIFMLPLPLTAIQLLLINLFTDGLPAIAMGIDPFERDIMRQMPRKAKEKIQHGLGNFLIGFPIIMTAATLAIFSFFLGSGASLIKAQTAAFLSIVMFKLFQAFACRSLRHSAFKAGIFRNRALVGAVIISFAFTVCVIYIPYLNPISKTFPLSALEFASVCAIAISGAAYTEISKIFRRKDA